MVVVFVVLGLLASDRVETKIAQMATERLSERLGTEVSIGGVAYRFPARVTLSDIYIEDLQRDTLAYIHEVYAHFSPLALRRNEIRFSHVRISEAVGKVYKHSAVSCQNSEVRSQDSDSLVWNYQFLVDAFKSEDEDEESGPMEKAIAVRDVQLDDIRVRWEDTDVQLDHAQMDLHELSEEAIDAQIGALRGAVRRKDSYLTSVRTIIASQSSVFKVEDVQARVILTDTVLLIPTLKAQLPQSRLDMSGGELRFPAGDTLYLSQSANDILISLGIREAELVPSDLAFFVPQLKNFRRPIAFNGGLNGTLDSLYFDRLALRYNHRLLLEGNISLFGLPDIANPYIRANLRDFHTNAAQLQDLLSQVNNQPVVLPDEIHRLGDIHYRGLASGRLHDLTLHGAFRTDLGSMTTDGTFRSDSTFDHMQYDARLESRQFQVGRMLAVDK